MSGYVIRSGPWDLGGDCYLRTPCVNEMSAHPDFTQQLPRKLLQREPKRPKRDNVRSLNLPGPKPKDSSPTSFVNGRRSPGRVLRTARGITYESSAPSTWCDEAGNP